jgi:hypothetical protein
MSCRDEITHNHPPALAVKTLLLLAFCLAGFSAHFLADSFEHFLWQPASEVCSLLVDHADHQEQCPPANRSTPTDCPASPRGAFLQDSLFRIFPRIAPLLNPPKNS